MSHLLPAPDHCRQGLVSSVHSPGADYVPGTTYDGREPNNHRPPWDVQQRSERPQRSPNAPDRDCEPFAEPRLHLGRRTRKGCELQQITNQRVGVSGREPARGETTVTSLGPAAPAAWPDARPDGHLQAPHSPPRTACQAHHPRRAETICRCLQRQYPRETQQPSVHRSSDSHRTRCSCCPWLPKAQGIFPAIEESARLPENRRRQCRSQKR